MLNLLALRVLHLREVDRLNLHFARAQIHHTLICRHPFLLTDETISIRFSSGDRTAELFLTKLVRGQRILQGWNHAIVRAQAASWDLLRSPKLPQRDEL